ncbi:hypothetical protein QE375_001938 [Microbacterium foliorum]|uniref:Fibronectin type-III domain-containing protein n=1 Tax=Microbacterium foliorum TaxID=104336 RepID=A0ABU1HSW0_9MICO|nr:hypothetical protein [Microbacterium foliorum]MDR6142384.1 hypothetical protein [Microbacterium foliorum]
MFDIRLRAFTPEGVKGRVLPTLSIASTDAESATATLQFSTTSRVAGRLEAPFVVGLEYTTGGKSWSRPRNDLYVVLSDAENAKDQTDVMTFTAQSYVGWLLSQAIHWWNTDSTDGRTRLYNMTPGKLVKQLVSEAQSAGRGWAPMLTTAFSDTADSLGQAWKADDQIKMEVDIWRPYSTLFQSWIEQGHFEWWAEGTTLMLARLGTGADLSSKIALGGPGFESAPAKTDFKGTFSTIVLIPDKVSATHTFNAGADTRFGALETSMTMSGVSDHATAVRMAQPVMRENRAKKLELSFDWTPAAGGPVPWVDFTIGDLVSARRKVGKLSQRVVGMQVSKRDGLVSARAIVGSKLVGLQAKIAKRAGSASQGGIIGGTGSGIPYNPGVKRPDPIAPSGLVVTSEAYFDATGTAYASVTATCSTVTTDVLGGTVKIKWYELWAKKNSSGEAWTRLATTTEERPSMTYTGLLAGESWSFRVRAYADEGVVSGYSPIFSLVLAKDTTPPPVPAPPTGTSKFTQVILTHNGLTDTGAAQPIDFAHFNVMMATTATGTGSKVGEMQGIPDTFVVPEQQVGQPRWYWVTAEDYSGNKSGPSTRISVVTKSLVPEDITQDVMDAISDIVSQDVVSSIGGTVTWATRDPADADGAGKPVGAMWYRRNNANTIIGMWEWTGTAPWVTRLIGADPIAAGAITDAKIATGAVLEAKLADAAVATAKLKDSAITEVKIANLAVGTAKIADAAILEAKIGNLAVSTAKIADAAIVTAKIGDAAITSAKIGDAQITNAKILNLDAGKVTTGFLDAARIAANTITTSKLAIADLTNYMDNPNVSDGTLSGWDDLFGKWEVATSTAGNIDRYLRRSPSFTGTATMLNRAVMAVRTGQRIRLSALTYCDGGGTQTLGVQWITASGGALSNSTFTVADSGNWVERSGEWDVPTNAFGARFRISDNGAAGSTTRIANPRLEVMGAGQLIIDGSITALKIATNAIESNKIAANAITADKIDAGAITTVKLAALAITSEKIAANAITASELTALAITSKHTITGAKFQTTATVNRGIEITSAGLSAYNSAGQKTIDIDAGTGDATITGTIRNRTTGPRVQINSSDTRGNVWFYTGTAGSSPASITSDPDGEGLMVFGGALSGGVRRASLQLYEQGANSVAGWYLGQMPANGSTVDPMGYINYTTNTNLGITRNSGHYITLASTGTTHMTGVGVQVNGNLVVTGAKNFAMAHPTLEGMSLLHASTESPHNGVEYWSDGFVAIPETGEIEVILEDYFEPLTAPDHRIVMLSAGSADAGLWSSPVSDGRFTIHGAPGALVAWLVKARRIQMRDGEDLLAFDIVRPTETVEASPGL